MERAGDPQGSQGSGRIRDLGGGWRFRDLEGGYGFWEGVRRFRRGSGGQEGVRSQKVVGSPGEGQ